MADKNDDVSVDAGNESDTMADPANEVDGLLDVINGLTTTPNTETEVPKETVVEKEKPPVVTPEVKDTSVPDRGLERLAAKEKEVRELRDSFEKERGQYLKIDDLKLKSVEALTRAGIDPDVLMKTILHDKLPDGNPVKAKLKAELSELLTDRKLRELDEKIERDKRNAQLAQEQARNYQETVAKIDGFIGKFKDADDKTLPTLSSIGKGDGGVLKELIIEEMINDAAQRYARGEDGDPISHEEAASRIEKRLARLLPLLNKSADANNTGSSNNTANGPGKKKPGVRPGPAQAKGQPQKTSAQELDDLISSVLSGR